MYPNLLSPAAVHIKKWNEKWSLFIMSANALTRQHRWPTLSMQRFPSTVTEETSYDGGLPPVEPLNREI